MCCLEHNLGEVEAHAKHLRAIDLEQREQTPVAGTEVEDSMSVVRHMSEQDALPLGAVREAIGALEIPLGMLGRRPLIGGHAVIIRRPRQIGARADGRTKADDKLPATLAARLVPAR